MYKDEETEPSTMTEIVLSVRKLEIRSQESGASLKDG